MFQTVLFKSHYQPKFSMTLLSHLAYSKFVTFPLFSQHLGYRPTFPPISGKNHFPLMFIGYIFPYFLFNFRVFCVIYLFRFSPISTMMHLCIMPYTYWTPLVAIDATSLLVDLHANPFTSAKTRNHRAAFKRRYLDACTHGGHLLEGRMLRAIYVGL